MWNLPYLQQFNNQSSLDTNGMSSWRASGYLIDLYIVYFCCEGDCNQVWTCYDIYRCDNSSSDIITNLFLIVVHGVW